MKHQSTLWLKSFSKTLQQIVLNLSQAFCLIWTNWIMRLCLLIFVCVGDHHISTSLQQSWVLVRSFSFSEAIEFHIVTCFICGVQVTSCDWLTQGQISHGRATALVPSVNCPITWWVRIHCPCYFAVESVEWHFFDRCIFFFCFNLIIKCNMQSVQCSSQFLCVIKMSSFYIQFDVHMW